MHTESVHVEMVQCMNAESVHLEMAQCMHCLKEDTKIFMASDAAVVKCNPYIALLCMWQSCFVSVLVNMLSKLNYLIDNEHVLFSFVVSVNTETHPQFEWFCCFLCPRDALPTSMFLLAKLFDLCSESLMKFLNLVGLEVLAVTHHPVYSVIL